MSSLIPTLAMSWPRFWDVLPLDLQPQAARTLIRSAQARDSGMRTVLTNLRASAGVHAARRMARRYLLSASAKIAAVSRAWQSRNGSLDKITDNDALDLVSLADSIFAWNVAPGRALAWPKLKRDGENYRLLHKFALCQRAQDEMAANAGRAIADLLPTQFNRSEQGIEKFEAWLTECLPNIQAVMTADIPSCFDNIRRSSVETSLLLPKRVIEAAMLKPMYRAKHLPGVLSGILTKNTHDVGTSAAKRSVPQGSALAQLAADIEIDKVLRAVAAVHGSVHVAAFGDNLLFLLEDAGLAGSVQAALTEAITKQFGSDVTTALVNRIRCDKPASFPFCRRTYSWKTGKLCKALPIGHVEDYVTKTMIKIQDAYAAKDDQRLQNCEKSVIAFVQSHGSIKGVFEECAALLVDVKHWRTLLAKKGPKSGTSP